MQDMTWRQLGIMVTVAALVATVVVFTLHEERPRWIFQVNGAEQVPENRPIWLINLSGSEISTGRFTPNPQKPEIQMGQASSQGGTVPYPGLRFEGGTGTIIGWSYSPPVQRTPLPTPKPRP